MPNRAAFIALEGLDRSGKSTQAANLEAKLKDLGLSVKLMKFPDRTTPIGKMIDSYLRSESEMDDHAIHLLFSANRWELASTIEHHLSEGTIVLTDRYAFSGIAFTLSKPSLFPPTEYSQSKAHIPSDILTSPSYEWCKSPDKTLPSPDLTLFFNISPSIARSRGGYGEERYENEDMQNRVRVVFDAIACDVLKQQQQEQQHQQPTPPLPQARSEEDWASIEKQDTNKHLRWKVIDAGKDKEKVAEDVWDAVRPFVYDNELSAPIGIEGPVKRLWTTTVDWS